MLNLIVQERQLIPFTVLVMSTVAPIGSSAPSTALATPTVIFSDSVNLLATVGPHFLLLQQCLFLLLLIFL